MIPNLTSWKVILILAIVFLSFVLYFFPSHLSQINEITGYDVIPLDKRFSYTKLKVYKLLSDMGQEGRKINIFITGVIDMIYPLIYATLFVALQLKLTSSFSNKKIKRIIIFPIIVMLLDYIENFGFLSMLTNFPNLSESQVNTNSIITSFKWIFVLITVSSVLILTVYNMYSKLKKNI